MITLKSELIKASAGTGKTYQLAVRYIAYLLNDDHPSRLIATTFTRKAAGEILDRIYSLLVQIAEGKLTDVLGLKVSKDDGIKLLKKLSAAQQSIKIITLDSFFNEIFSFFATSMQIPVSYKLVDDEQNKKNRKKIVNLLFQKLESQEALDILNEFYDHKLPIDFKQQILKTLENYSEQYGIAYENYWKNYDEVRSPKIQDIIHKFQERFGLEYGVPEKTREKELEALIEGNFKYLTTRERIKKIADRVVVTKTHNSKTLIDQEAVEVYQEITLLIQEYIVKLLNKKNRSMARFFSMQRDLSRTFIERTGSLNFYNIKELLAESSLLGKLDLLYFRLDSRINHLMLDEFQDTSVLDWTILSPVIDEISVDPARSIFVVGDQKQSIYGWRGGTPELFNSVEESLGDKINISSLNESYRCSPVVLEFVNDVFGGLDKTKLAEEYPGIVTDWRNKFNPQIAKKQIAGHVKLTHADEDSVTQIADFIKKLINDYPQAKIGVLSRANKDLNELKAKLNHQDYKISFSDDAGISIYSNPTIRSILALLEWMDHPSKTVCSYIFFNSEIARGLGFSENSEELQKYTKKLRNKIFNDGYIAGIRMLLNNSKFIPDYENNLAIESLYNLAGSYEFRNSRLSEFVRFIENKTVSNQSTAQVSLMTIHKSKGLEFDIVLLPDFDSDLVNGKYVTLVSNQSRTQIVPNSFSLKGRKDFGDWLPELEKLSNTTLERNLDEQLSVMYVAFTRAKHSLYIFGKFTEDKLNYSSVIKDSGAALEYGAPNFEISNNELSNPVITYPNSIKIKQSEYWTRTLPVKNPSKEDTRQFFSTALNRGTAIHRILQDITWWNGEVINAYPKSYSKYVEEVTEMLNQHKFEFLNQTSDCEVYNEFKFSVTDTNSILTGSVDRIMVFTDRIEIYDYKSDRGEIDSNLLTHYHEQLVSYADALSKIFKDKNIFKNLVMLESGNIISF